MFLEELIFVFQFCGLCTVMDKAIGLPESARFVSHTIDGDVCDEAAVVV